VAAGAKFTYNDPSQTTSITPPGGTARTQAYDGVMQDRRTQDSETTMSYGYAGLTAQQTGTVGTAGHAELFVRDPAGTLITMLDNTTGTPSSIGQATYYLLDDQGSVIATIADTEPSSTQPVGVTRHLYEPYGQTIRDWTQPDPGNGDSGSENPNLTAPATDYNPFGYIAGYTDPDTGLIKFGTRYYIPQLGTWTQPDSEQGSSGTPPSLNLFAYSRGNPGNLTDPSGRFPGEDFLAIDSVGDAFLVAGVNLGVQALISAPLSLGCTGGIAVATGLAGTIAGAVGCAALTATVSGFIKGQIYEEVGYEY